MKYFKPLIALLVISLLPLSLLAASLTASQTLQNASDRLRNAKSVDFSFTILSQRGNAKGTLTLSNDRFHMTSDGVQIWYDGVTQWSYSPADKEVSVIEPTPDELQQVNPFAIISSFRNAYDASFAKVSPLGTKTIVLKAKSPRAQIASAQITVNEKTLDPTAIELFMRDKQKLNIQVNSVKIGGNLSISAFRFDKSKFPGVAINDLR